MVDTNFYEINWQQSSFSKVLVISWAKGRKLKSVVSVEFHLHGVYRGISRKKEFVPGIFFGKEDFLVRFIRDVRFQIIQGWIKYTSWLRSITAD